MYINIYMRMIFHELLNAKKRDNGEKIDVITFDILYFVIQIYFNKLLLEVPSNI